MTPYVSASERNTYERDGVVCLRAVFDAHWLESLRDGLEDNVRRPGPMSRFYANDEAGNWFFYDTLSWSRIEAYRHFITDSPVGAIAGELMGAREVRLFNDIVFYRGVGTQTRSPFHQDLPHWCFDTGQVVSLWMPLVAVEKASALEFVAGSHRWNKTYLRPPFSAIDTHTPGQDTSYEPIPDIETQRDKYEVISWDMEPGDILMFHGLTLHGGSGNLRADRDLKVFGANFMGEQARFTNRAGGTDPDLTSVCALYGLSEGSPMACDGFPRIWQRT